MACDRFTILESREGDRLARCDVCDQVEEDHDTKGRRRMTGGQIEELRRKMLMMTYSKQEEDRKRREGNGESTVHQQ